MIKAEGAESVVASETWTHHHRRSSVFFETGLGGQDTIVDARIRRSSRPKQQVRFRSTVDVYEPDDIERADESVDPHSRTSHSHSSLFPILPRVLFIACVLALFIPCLTTSISLESRTGIAVAEGASATKPDRARKGEDTDDLARRQTTSIDYCTRWSQQTALVNGTLYIYGGRASQQPLQKDNTWST